MPARPVLLWPDPRLTEVCAPVGDADVSGLIDDMFATMYAAPGRGLAAPQVGVMLRVFVMDATWKDGPQSPVACIDPEIIEASDEMASGREACLSIPGIGASVARHARVRLRWTDPAGTRQDARLSGFEAICAQHEIDHLDGRVIFDRVSAETRAMLEQAYGGRE